jgi:hypothetical protein
VHPWCLPAATGLPLTNALAHLAPNPSLKLDVRHFYPSMTFAHVVRFFSNELECARDVAHVLASICCFSQRHLRTCNQGIMSSLEKP